MDLNIPIKNNKYTSPCNKTNISGRTISGIHEYLRERIEFCVSLKFLISVRLLSLLALDIVIFLKTLIFLNLNSRRHAIIKFLEYSLQLQKNIF
jgi:hypothetical protein